MTRSAVDAVTGTGPPPGTPPRLSSKPGARRLLVSSWLWHCSRWSGLFASTYLVTVLADEPLLNQLVGMAFFSPMIVGGLLAGALSDRIDRRRLVMGTQLFLVPISLAMFSVVQAGLVRVWMVLPFMFLLGLGGVVNMTAQRPLIYETVGPELAQRAMFLETAAMASASVTGALVGGAVIETLGIGAGFGLVGLALAGSIVLLRAVPSPPASPAVPVPGARGGLRSHAAAIAANPALANLLGVTVVFNLFFASIVPLVPTMAKGWGAGAAATGVLGAGLGCGQLLGASVMSSLPFRRAVTVFVSGAGVCFAGLGLFAVAPSLPVGFLALLLAGVGQAGFGAMQAVIAMDVMGAGRRGTALGLLSTAIGVMPLGMLLLGVVAQSQGTRLALGGSSLVGATALAVVACRFRSGARVPPTVVVTAAPPMVEPAVS
jgi:MFS family permease